jgi:hypothetical protein
VIGINDDIGLRDDHEGLYPANEIIGYLQGNRKGAGGTLQCLQAGNSSDLNAVILGTDGLYDFTSLDGDPLGDMAMTLDRELQPGYDRLFFREFRRRVVTVIATRKPNLLDRPHDDRTLIVLRRIDNSPAQKMTRRE